MRLFYLMLVIFLVTAHTKLHAQVKKVIDEDLHYVVIGAFNIPKNATRYVNEVKKQFAKADYAFNENKKLYYVFIEKMDDHALAIEEAKKLQAAAQYPDAWVYGKPSEVVVMGGDFTPGTSKETTVAISDVSGSTLATQPAIATPTEATVVKKKNDESTKEFYFKVFSSGTSDTINGNIDLIDIETNKKANTFLTNQSVLVKLPNKSGNVLFACEILGYRAIKRNLNLNNPLASVDVTQIVEQEGQFVLPFELVRLKKGDIVVIYDLFFYKDAAIMRGESRQELRLLMDMMNENAKYKIRLHGHTNGGGNGKIIRIGPDKNFFSLSGSKEGFGSSTKLSEERAQAVKEYMVSQGIDGSRIEIKAWGGKKPLYDVEHAQAQSNVRVEVEILED